MYGGFLYPDGLYMIRAECLVEDNKKGVKVKNTMDVITYYRMCVLYYPAPFKLFNFFLSFGKKIVKSFQTT